MNKKEKFYKNLSEFNIQEKPKVEEPKKIELKDFKTVTRYKNTVTSLYKDALTKIGQFDSLIFQNNKRVEDYKLARKRFDEANDAYRKTQKPTSKGRSAAGVSIIKLRNTLKDMKDALDTLFQNIKKLGMEPTSEYKELDTFYNKALANYKQEEKRFEKLEDSIDTTD
ncbi:MAG: hypothetical protein Unbinned4264contig1000_42 [Prokaryotic dsDNA virus sp.]|nr:MAG: hypothetical protein Unbinned4264contig1000_42 [Prokaryotic dsDNA virus sp.]|tara:strand:+ start:12383 stop:12886 length:504 start_codon:yes stop_codon:yes gene_type:complete